MNIAEYQHLADHLQPEECRKLIASLHYHSYDMPNAVDEAERKVSKDVSCLKQLLHWNSAKGEGKGETHEVLQHRLRQLNRPDLADWLGKTVFHELALDLERSLNEPFKEILNETTTIEQIPVLPTESIKVEDPTEWTPIDTVVYTLLVSMIGILMLIFVRQCWRKFSESKYKNYKKKSHGYEKMDESTEYGSDSEEIFDIRSKVYN